MPRPATVGKPRGSSGSLFSRAITSLISIEGSDAATAEQVRAGRVWMCRLRAAGVAAAMEVPACCGCQRVT